MDSATFNVNMHSPLMLSTSSSISPSPMALSLPSMRRRLVWFTGKTSRCKFIPSLGKMQEIAPQLRPAEITGALKIRRVWSLTIGASREFYCKFCKHFAGACAHHTLGCSTYITIKNSLDTSLSDLDPDWIILSVWVYLYTKIISHVTMYTHTICIHIQYVDIYIL